jgi:LDH2 family malate/lactate/ureidoglycolate dehydrogenase
MLTTTRETLTVSSNALLDWAQRVFETTGMSRDNAHTAAQVLVSANLRGVDSHGILRIKNYLDRLNSGLNNPRPNITIERDNPNALLVNGDNGTGMVVGVYAMRLAITRAREFGVASVGVHHSSHYGMAAYYAIMAAEQDMVGLTLANTSPAMPPWGGVTPYLGTNPLAFAAPGGFVFDMATTQVSGGKFMVAMREGRKIPTGWATDRAGKPTDDPEVAWNGLYAPLGGYKGFGLALMVEILASTLTGAAHGPHVYQPPSENKPGADVNVGHFFMAIDIARFCPLEIFRARMAQLADEIHACEPVTPGDDIYLPGERSQTISAQRSMDGIPLSSTLISDLQAIGARSGVPFIL